MMKKSILILAFTLLNFNSNYAQSPWTKEKGKAYVQLGYTNLSYNTIQLDGKKIEKIGDFVDNTIQIYSEYGITNKLEAQLILPYKSASYENIGVSQSISGLGNVSLGLKYKLSDKTWKISSGLLYLANTISKNKELIVSTTGINSATTLPYITIGSSKNKWYYFGNVGYGYMDNDFSDFFKASFEVGYNIIPKGHLMFVFDSRNPIEKGKAFNNFIAGTDDFQWASHLDRQTYNAFGIKANYEFSKDKFGANFAGYGAFGNNNAPLAPTLSLGIYTKL